MAKASSGKVKGGKKQFKKPGVKKVNLQGEGAKGCYPNCVGQNFCASSSSPYKP